MNFLMVNTHQGCSTTLLTLHTCYSMIYHMSGIVKENKRKWGKKYDLRGAIYNERSEFICKIEGERLKEEENEFLISGCTHMPSINLTNKRMDFFVLIIFHEKSTFSQPPIKFINVTNNQWVVHKWRLT